MPTIGQKSLVAILDVFRDRYADTVVKDDSGRIAVDGVLPSAPTLARIANAVNKAREAEGVAMNASFRIAPNVPPVTARVTVDDLREAIRYDGSAPDRVFLPTVRFPAPGVV